MQDAMITRRSITERRCSRSTWLPAPAAGRRSWPASATCLISESSRTISERLVTHTVSVAGSVETSSTPSTSLSTDLILLATCSSRRLAMWYEAVSTPTLKPALFTAFMSVSMFVLSESKRTTARSRAKFTAASATPCASFRTFCSRAGTSSAGHSFDRKFQPLKFCGHRVAQFSQGGSVYCPR